MSRFRALAVGLFVFVVVVPVNGDVSASPPPADTFHGVVPARLMDTRVGGATVDGQFVGAGAVGAGSTTNVTVLNRGGVPGTGVGAVALNVTAAAPTATSFVTVWPAGAAQPNASNLNLTAGVNSPNMVIVAVGAGGQISLFNESGSTHLLVDVLGWFPTGASFTGLVPARLMDTRVGGSTVDGQFVGTGAVGAGSVTNLTILNRGGVPASGVGAVALNVTAAAPTDTSFVTVWPAGASQPNASNLNLRAGVNSPNMVIVAVGAGGQISLFNESGSTHLLVDVLGWFPTGPSFTGLVPARLMDTRVGGATVDGQFVGAGAVGAGSTTNVTVLNRGGVPGAGVGAVALNVTAAAPTATSFVTVWPAGAAQPNASNLNLTAGVNSPNMVIVAVGAGGQISLFNESGSTHLIVDVLGWFPTPTASPSTKRASVKTGGAQALLGSTISSVSADGRYITYSSIATDLVTPDGNGIDDIFLFDRNTVTTTRISVSSAGLEANGQSSEPKISADGNFVVYASTADNLLTPVVDSNSASDIFLYDRNLATTIRISGGTGLSTANGASDGPAISSDGRYITFRSAAFNLVGPGGDPNGAVKDVFLFDRIANTTTLISVSSLGVQGNSQSDNAGISGDGRFVSFASFANNLVLNDTSGNYDIFVRDRTLNTTTRVSVSSAGTQQDAASLESGISADGRFVTFVSGSTNLVIGDTNGKNDVFVHDRNNGRTFRVSVDNAGTQANDDSDLPSISGDGRYVVYQSDATNLAAGDGNSTGDVFLYDSNTATTTRISSTSTGTAPTGTSYAVAISSNGRFISYGSSAGDIITGDTNGDADVFLFDQGTS